MGLHTTYICLLVIAAADVTQCKHRSVDSANGTKSTEGLKLLQSAHHKSKVPCHKTNISIRKRKLLKVGDEVERALGKSGESLMSMSLHAPHSGKSPDLLVPYEVRKGVHGMGVFTTRPVEKGQKLWVFNAKHHVKIYKEDVPLLHDLLRSKDPNIAVWLTRWTYASEYCENCVLFEMDDGRYMNDAKGPNNNEVSDKGGLVAKEYIPTNTEILEDYDKDGVAKVPGWWQACGCQPVCGWWQQQCWGNGLPSMDTPNRQHAREMCVRLETQLTETHGCRRRQF